MRAGRRQATGASGSEEPSAAAVDPTDREIHEAAGANPRVAATYDGSVLILDALTGDQLADLSAAGFTRLDPAAEVPVTDAGLRGPFTRPRCAAERPGWER